MRPGNLSPDATVVTTVLLGLSLVDVSHPLSLVPCHLLGSVDSFDLDKGCVWVLVGLGPTQPIKRQRPRQVPNGFQQNRKLS